MTTGELWVGGDWACAHGDFAGLGEIAKQLAIRAPEPMHCMFWQLADACRANPDRAADLWSQLKLARR